MGKLKELNDVVDIAKEIMKKDKNIGWLVAIEEAKKILFKDKEIPPKESEWTNYFQVEAFYLKHQTFNSL